MDIVCRSIRCCSLESESAAAPYGCLAPSDRQQIHKSYHLLSDTKSEEASITASRILKRFSSSRPYLEIHPIFVARKQVREMASKILLPLLVVLASTPRVICQNAGSSTIMGADDVGLYDIPTSDYSDPDKANATGQITFDRYTLTLAVSADVPIPDEDSVAMTSVLSLGIDTAGPNLTNCVAVYYSGLSANVTAAAADLEDSQDGLGCGKMLSDECVSDLLFAASQGLNSDCSSFLPSVPSSCTAQFGDLSAVGGGEWSSDLWEIASRKRVAADKT